MYVSLNANDVIDAVSQQPINIKGKKTLKIDLSEEASKLIGKRLLFGKRKETSELRIAVICNWGDRCGIATYTGFLLNALRDKVADLKIFAEHSEVAVDEEGVVRCWKRGESMVAAIQQVLEWGPDLVFIQHEFGIFPKATHFLKMLEMLDHVPYVITCHSVYEHLDKTVCTAYIKNMIVHSNHAKASLHRLGHTGNVYVIPHGCVVYQDVEPLWNLFQNDYTIIQFGFGFEYKGVDTAVEAIQKLKENDPKFKDIFYCYMCSESVHTRTLQERYYQQIRDRVKAMGLEENVVVMRGYLSEQHLCNFMRTAKLAIFPYKNNPNNVVYGASGAIRKAMANGIPIIASESHLFDDLENIVPRPSDADMLACEIDKVFSDEQHRISMINNNLQFVKDNNWVVTADRHLTAFTDIIAKSEVNTIRVES